MTYPETASQLLNASQEIIFDLPFLRDTALVPMEEMFSFSQINTPKLYQVESKEEKQSDETIERLFTMMYSRNNTKYFLQRNELKIPNYILSTIDTKLPQYLYKHIIHLPILENDIFTKSDLEEKLLESTFWQYQSERVSSIDEVLSVISIISRKLTLPIKS